jgi:hypothetical protein
MDIKNVIFPLPLKQVGDCIEVDAPRLTNRKKLRWRGENWFAHRLSYRLNCEDIPCRPPNLKEGLVLHSCDNGWCINPDHLSIGSSKRNTIERVLRNHNWRLNVSKGIKLSWDKMTKEEKDHKLRGLTRTQKDVPRESHSGRFRRNSL